ncbi:pyridoxamine 5'-phosphate oxidase family protein [Rhodococcus zopfii]|uniref:pyridoxamine 5'-phosphate oxidase family protein n=1 Tax=Rhodococcus zopfii TaxID=43772 RepID=UPI00111104CF|nr:pyridoxamine 5'-phosphate oxidase family protein [Rhodococcus zopfii]
MATWGQFRIEAPELAEAIAARWSAHKHHVLATLRRDGSPRVSGTEVEIVEDRLAIGSMPGALKARDLRRDGRYALHANPGHHDMAGGDAKVAGRARELLGDEKSAFLAAYPSDVPEGPMHLFELDIDEAVLVTVDDKLHVDLWRPGAGVVRYDR